MAHSWTRVTDKRAALRTCRECVHCGVLQHYDSRYGWDPGAGRCTTNAKSGRKPKTRDAILAVMDGPTRVAEIVERTGLTRGVVQSALTRAKKALKVQGVEGERGAWEKVENSPIDKA